MAPHADVGAVDDQQRLHLHGAGDVVLEDSTNAVGLPDGGLEVAGGPTVAAHLVAADVDAPAEVLGVEGEDTRRAQHQVVDVGASCTDGQVVKHAPMGGRQRGEGSCDRFLPHSPLGPGPAGVTAADDGVDHRIGERASLAKLCRLAARALARPVGAQVPLPADEVLLAHTAPIDTILLGLELDLRTFGTSGGRLRPHPGRRSSSPRGSSPTWSSQPHRPAASIRPSMAVRRWWSARMRVTSWW